MTHSSKVEAITGFVVFAAAILFLLYAFQTNDMQSHQGYQSFRAKFSNIGSIEAGSDVKLAGVKVGSVSETKLNNKDYQAEITLSIVKDITLPEDSIVKIASDGLLGGSFIAIEAGSADDLMQSGDVFYNTQSNISLVEMLSRAVFSNQ